MNAANRQELDYDHRVTAASLRRWAFSTYYRLRPTQAGKNRGLAYRLLRPRR